MRLTAAIHNVKAIGLSIALASALAVGLLGGAPARAGMLPAGSDAIEADIVSYNAQTGRLDVGGRTVYVIPETIVERLAGARTQSMPRGSLAGGQHVRVVFRAVNGHNLARSVQVIDRGRSQLK
jgi:hypothetical protein